MEVFISLSPQAAILMILIQYLVSYDLMCLVMPDMCA